MLLVYLFSVLTIQFSCRCWHLQEVCGCMTCESTLKAQREPLLSPCNALKINVCICRALHVYILKIWNCPNSLIMLRYKSKHIYITLESLEYISRFTFTDHSHNVFPSLCQKFPKCDRFMKMTVTYFPLNRGSHRCFVGLI